MANKIIYFMIARNEAKIIRRCLESVVPIVDAVCICENGPYHNPHSDDNMVEVIKQLLNEHNIPYRIMSHTWKNFMHNRSLSFIEAQTFAMELGWDLEHSYGLTLDADMILQVGPKFDKANLKQDWLRVIQITTSKRYPNSRLFKMSLNWKSVCVTHEYWDADEAKTSAILETLTIDDRCDGGCKADKYERDVKLLLEGLKEEPDNTRYYFYLAQSYWCLDEFDKAIEWYAKRIEAKGHPGEVYYSHYAIGCCYMEWADELAERAKRVSSDSESDEESDDEAELEEWSHLNRSQAIDWWLKAYQCDPTRAESLGKLVQYYRKIDNHQLATMFAKWGMAVPQPPQGALFVHHQVYDHDLKYAFAMSGYHTQHRDEAFSVADKLILTSSTLPEWKRDELVNQEVLYANKLNVDHKLILDLDRPWINGEQQYLATNPSIIQEPHGYTLVVRMVNYQHDHQYRLYNSMSSDGKLKTRNYLVKYNKQWQFQSQNEIIDPLRSEHAIKEATALGIEDLRLFKLGSSYWCSGTTLDTCGPDQQTQISLVRLSKSLNADGCYEMDRFRPLESPYQQKWEKNWLPYVQDGEIRMLHSYQPLTILKPDLETGKVEVIKRAETGFRLKRFRGGASPLEWDGGYLIVTHDVVYKSVTRPNGRKVDQASYLHRFVWFDKQFQLKTISRPFVFESAKTEFCCGSCIDHTGKFLVLSCGLNDSQAVLYCIGLDKVRDQLKAGLSL